MNRKIIIALLFCLMSVLSVYAQDGVHYTGKTLSNVDYHHGQLSPAVGTHNIQTFRANREYPQKAEGLGWTYNHAPMLAYWNGTFYLEYLNAPVGEHMPPTRTMIQTSKDGYSWTTPVTLFPEYKVPDGYTKPNYKGVAKDLYAITHQRVGFYTAKNGKLLAMSFYGVALDMKDDPNDGNGIGRVVREINKDGSFGPIYFIRYSHAFNEKNTDYPFYKKSKDKAFVQACDELLADPLYMLQWIEEADRNDPIIPKIKPYKALSYYHLNDGRVVGLWKHALTTISNDGGRTWPEAAYRAPGFVNSNAKIWGQKTSDGKYATVYNPSEFRWPLAVSTSEDGLEYTNLYLVHGDLTPMRYGGNYKSRGPQYVRGILENNGNPPGDDMWVTYSVNKEDMWVSKVPVPITDMASSHADEVFNDMPEGKELDVWNIYSPLWAPVKIEKRSDGKRWLSLKDWDLFDHAKAERVIPESKTLEASFSVLPMQNDKGNLQIEFQNEKGETCTRIIFDKDGTMKLKTGARYNGLTPYKANQVYNIQVSLNTATRSLTMKINDKQIPTRLFFNPVESITRIVFRTGDLPTDPNPNTPADRFTDLPNAGDDEPRAEYYISYLKTSNPSSTSAILNVDDYKSYVDYFNAMEDENIVQAIPNSESWNWMKANIPLFECPQANFQEMYYYRWWSFRKHIKETPVGYIMTEFLVNRSYADKYNLIACALGHHIYESRWLHDQKYTNQYVHVWFRGNEGQPMNKLRNFSSWTANALYSKYLVDGDSNYLLDMYPDLEKEYAAWEDDHRQPSGLYWQGDVQDGMEETISGGRRKKYARPTINSYMYGNAMALAEMAEMKGDAATAKKYKEKADEIKNLVQTQLWNSDSIFFETLREPGRFALVREAIGYIPWYFNLPDAKPEYAQAWKQVIDEKGFLAPYGMTTAERRHPLFRTHGCCKCEWDGAIWPFATSQTLTAMANLLNGYKQDVVNDSVYFRHMELYVESQYHRGRPYIGEYQDEVTGYWLKGDQERSRYYNHSTFNDLIISGLVGLRPRADEVLEVNPLIPQDKWDWFCLDNVPYHGKTITIVWDKTGEKYKRGKGFYAMVDGKVVAKADFLTKLTYKMK
ncbi:glycosyl hydrolase family 65 protein [Dysgonomonas sp. 511]|uniref:MGH1-like glycoside hydrolase domain-containing protein n=1 Tax=Dysgonomonas sp. 511 TaxID=2302930 RepID=UPI0013D4630D|nr:glycosyl hydrolase family 65 protein [Dysgonomonas sp. 511]NDV78090.1 six-hairpin glycosidase [Dysgonomonas sp. 511]